MLNLCDGINTVFQHAYGAAKAVKITEDCFATLYKRLHIALSKTMNVY